MESKRVRKDDAALVADPRIAAVNHIWREFDEVYGAVALRLGISESVLDALYTLYLEDGITQKDICERSCTSKQTVHSAIKQLEGRGMVRAERGKGRAVRLYLTEAGRAEAARTARPVLEAEKQAYDTLSPQEFEQLIGLLERVGARLHAGMDRIGADA